MPPRSSSSRARSLGASVALLLAMAPALEAAAQPAPSPPGEPAADLYRQHMKNGVKLFQDGNYEAAIVEFRAAYGEVPKASPLVNIALCYKAQFRYPKAIGALEQALDKHADTMDAADEKAAAEAIAEMRALLAYVTVQVTPAEAMLVVDGEEQPASAVSAPIALGPGTHKIGARAPGYAVAEASVTVASGDKDEVVKLDLVADQGFVDVVAGDAETAIAIDGRAVGYGKWSGLLAPGSHVVQMYKDDEHVESRQILVMAGKTQEVRPGSGGVAISAPTPAPPPSSMKKPEPAKPKRGFYGLITGSLLGPATQPKGFPNPKPNTGAAGGLRVGYRVNTAAGFDAMFEHGNATVTSNEDTESEYSISSTRFGLNLRLMTPGKTVRFVGSIGGGGTYTDLAFDLRSALVKRCAEGTTSASCDLTALRECTGDGCTGLDPYLFSEVALELDFGGVLLDAALDAYFQSSKGIARGPYDNGPLTFIGGGLRFGYGLW